MDTLYTILPGIVQRRVPKLLSFRKSHFRYSSTDSDDSTTPPPSYRTRPSTPLLTDLDDDAFCSAPSSRPSTSGSVPPLPLRLAEPKWEEDGISCKNARHGLRMLELSAQEYSSPYSDKVLSRRLFVDGIGYLLQGLPNELRSEEAALLRAAVPRGVLESSQTPELARADEPSGKPPSVLHRAIASSTCYAILALLIIVPYAQALAQQVWAFDRKYKLSDRCMQQGALMFQIMGASMLSLAAMIWNLKEGQMRELCRDTGVWLIKDFSGGAHEGVGKAIERLKLEDKANPRTEA